MFNTLWNFLKKDFRIETTYKANFLLNIVGIFIAVMMFFFIAKLVPGNAVSDYGGDYFSFVLIGIALSSFISVGVFTFSRMIRIMQLTGTLETILATPTKLPVILFGSTIWSFIMTVINVAFYFVFGIFVFDMKINAGIIGIAIAVLILVLAIICFSSIGIIAAGLILIFKKGESLIGTTNKLFDLLGGMLFPIELLPFGIRVVSYMLPITYALRSLRHVLIQGYSFGMVSFDILVLAGFCVLLVPLSIFIVKLTLRKAKKDGSLIKY